MRNRAYEENLIHTTLKNELVRSKSEVIVANILCEMRIDYEYEKPFKGKDGRIVYPDFTILYKRGKILIEYMGMMSNTEYVKKNTLKLQWYFAQGVQLIKNYDPKGIKNGIILVSIMEESGIIDAWKIERGLKQLFLQVNSSLLFTNNERLQKTKIYLEKLLDIPSDEEIKIRKRIVKLDRELTEMGNSKDSRRHQTWNNSKGCIEGC